MKNEKKYYYELDTLILNILSIVLILVFGAITLTIYGFKNIDLSNYSIYGSIFMCLMIAYFILHEIVHGIMYVLGGANPKNITYGIHLEKGILCCSCKQNITKKNILTSLISPFLLLGVITYAIGLIIDSKMLVLLSLCNISGCSGDIVMFIDFLKLKKFKYFEYDNPTAFGIITSEDLSKKKLFGLKKKKEENPVQTKTKKITISKFSIIFFIFFAILCLLNYLIIYLV